MIVKVGKFGFPVILTVPEPELVNPKKLVNDNLNVYDSEPKRLDGTTTN